jgi:hypothetical protein
MNPGHKRIARVLAVAGLMLSTAPTARADAGLEWDVIAMRPLTTPKPTVKGLSDAERVVGFNPHVSLPNDLKRTTTGDNWPNIHVEDAYTRHAATRALEGASRLLALPKCQTLFLEFRDKRNLPLTAKLRELDTDPEGYLLMVLFLDGEQSATCRRHGVLAFTAQGSRVVYLCGRDFERAWRRDVAEVQATVIHEMLHSLGLGENPPSPRAINHRIQQLCW